MVSFPYPEGSALISALKTGANLPLPAVGLKWDVLVKMAEFHRVTPGLIQAAPLDKLAPEIQVQLQRAQLAWVAQAMLLNVECRRLLDAFEKNRIPVATFKGPVQCAWLYGPHSPRSYGDLDFIVPPTHFAAARAMLNGLGYAAYYGENSFRRSFASARYCEELWVHGGHGVQVDLHWQIVPPGFEHAPDLAELFTGLQQVPFENGLAPLFATEELFVLLCLHGAKHGWCQFALLCDLQALAQKPALNWARITAYAEHRHLSRMLWTGVGIMQSVLDTPLPVEIQRRAQQDQAGDAMAIALDLLLQPPLGEDKSMEEQIYRLHLNPADVGRLRRWCYYPCPLEWQAFDLPVGLGWLYFPYRALRLLARKIRG